MACRYTASRIAEVAQLVEHRSEKPGVDSSILSLGTTILNTNWSAQRVARGGISSMRAHSSRTHSSDRGQGAAQAAPPISQQEVDRLSRIADTARRSAAWKQWRQNLRHREVGVFGFSSASSVPSAARSSVMRRRVSSSSMGRFAAVRGRPGGRRPRMKLSRSSA